MKHIAKTIFVLIILLCVYFIHYYSFLHQEKGPNSKEPSRLTELTYIGKEIVSTDKEIIYHQIEEENFAVVQELCSSSYGLQMDYTVHDYAYDYCVRNQDSPSTSDLPPNKSENSIRFVLYKNQENHFVGSNSELYYSIKENSCSDIQIAEQLLSSSPIVKQLDGCYFIDDDIRLYSIKNLENTHISWVACNHMEKVNDSMVPFLSYLDHLYTGQTISYINSVPLVITYFYQIQADENPKDAKEKYVYFVYYKKNDLTQLIQFSSNWTLIEPDSTNQFKEFINALSQEECRTELIRILKDIIKQ